MSHYDDAYDNLYEKQRQEAKSAINFTSKEMIKDLRRAMFVLDMAAHRPNFHHRIKEDLEILIALLESNITGE